MNAARYLRDAAVFAPCYVAARLGELHRPARPVQHHAVESAAGARRRLDAARRAAPRPGRARHHLRSPTSLIRACARRLRWSPLLTALTLAAGYAGIAAALRAPARRRRAAQLRASSRCSSPSCVAGTARRSAAAFVGVLRAAGLLARASPFAGLAALLGRRRGRRAGHRAAAARGRRHGAPRGLRAPRAAARVARRRSPLLAATLWLIFDGARRRPFAPFLPAVPAAHLDRGPRRHERRASSRRRSCRSASCSAIRSESAADAAGRRAAGPGGGAHADRACISASWSTSASAPTEDLRQSLRLAAAGEMAGAIAHEVNQPLTALANYGRSALAAARRGGEAHDRAAGGDRRRCSAKRERAADVVRRLRDFFRAGTTRLESVAGERARGDAAAASARADDRRAADRARASRLEPGAARAATSTACRSSWCCATCSPTRSRRCSGHGRVRVASAPARTTPTTCASWSTTTVPASAPRRRERMFEPFVSGKPTRHGPRPRRQPRHRRGARRLARCARRPRHGEFHLVLPCHPAKPDASSSSTTTRRCATRSR